MQLVYFYSSGKEAVLYSFREISVELMKWMRWLKWGMSGRVLEMVQPASELLPVNLMWPEQNTPPR